MKKINFLLPLIALISLNPVLVQGNPITSETTAIATSTVTTTAEATPTDLIIEKQDYGCNKIFPNDEGECN